VVEGSPELEEDVDEEGDVDAVIQDAEDGGLQQLGLEAQFERDAEAVVQGKNDYEQFPVGLAEVVLADQKLLVFRLHDVPAGVEEAGELADGAQFLLVLELLLLVLGDLLLNVGDFLTEPNPGLFVVLDHLPVGVVVLI